VRAGETRVVNAIRKLVAFYRYIYLNLPQMTRAAGVGLILAIGLIHLVEAPEHFEAATYLRALFVANFAVTLASAFGILQGSRTWGWTLGAVASGLALVAYPVSRIFGLPGFPEGVGEWDEPLGSLAMIFEGLFLTGWFSVITGLAVAAPDKRDWHD
jgi:hypothetical protein